MVDLCQLLALRLVKSQRSGWLICKRILPQHIIKPNIGVRCCDYLSGIFRTIMSVDGMGYGRVHTALSNLLELSLLGQTESDAILNVLSKPGNDDIVSYLRASFTPGSVSSALLSELLRNASETVPIEGVSRQRQFNVVLQQWNTCHRSLEYLMNDFMTSNSVTALDVLSLLAELCTTTTSAEGARREDLSLGNIQKHEAISVSFHLLEAYQAASDCAPPLTEDLQKEVTNKGKELHRLMLRTNFDKNIRLKLILAFNLTDNARLRRAVYRKSICPVFEKHPVEEKQEISVSDVKVEEVEVEEDDTKETADVVGALKDNWFDSDSDDENGDDDDAPPTMGARMVSTMSATSDIGHNENERESRMYMHWACDVMMRQSQRASYFDSLKDDNCYQLIRYLMNNHPHPPSTDGVSTSTGCMLPALIFTFEKVIATEMATKMVDVYSLDLLDGVKDKEATRDLITREIEGVEEDVPSFLKRVLIRGIGIHHGGISGSCRDLVERLFNKKLIQIVFNTSSLAEGVHMPCQTVVFLQDKQNLINSKVFRQCAGRAGRQGDSNVGFVVVTGNYTISRLKTLLKSLDNDGELEGEYGITDSVASSTSMLMPAARLNLLARDANFGQRIPLCLSEHRNFNHQKRKVDYVLDSIQQMMGEKTANLCIKSVEIDIRLRPLYAFCVRIFVSHIRNSYKEAGDVMDAKARLQWIRAIVNLILWFRKPIESRAYRTQMRSFHRRRQECERAVPLLDPMPSYIREAVKLWNQHVYQSLLLAEEGNLLASSDDLYTDGQSQSHQPGIYSVRNGEKRFGPMIRQSQLLLESSRVVERVPPAIDGLSGHAYAFVASGVTKNNMTTLFTVPYDSLPFLDPDDIVVKSKQGFVLKFIFGKSEASVKDDVERSVMFNGVQVRYGVDKYALNSELNDIRNALITIKRFVDNYIPGPRSDFDPVYDVIDGALDRLALFKKAEY